GFEGAEDQELGIEQLAPDVVQALYEENQETYARDVLIAGELHKASYLPIKDAVGTTIGVWSAAVSKTAVQEGLDSTLGRIGLISLLGLLLTMGALMWALQRVVIAPVAFLVRQVEAMAS